ncbi:hypothetical protein [Mycobacterium sp. 1245805.9]|uniref:hypothetical protein n=1 Tax=Mycobacterium sp. 1245805.9 TaxID=1856862 RepID=UPI0012EA6952|nr:hypothetical protein [Mycobacterium sp. 1245805.9]
MTEPIVGKVAAIENNFNLVINRGSNHGVKSGMIFAIEDPQGKEIRDPESDELLGYVPTEKIKVKVFEVQEKLSRATTFVRVLGYSTYEDAARQLLAEYRSRPVNIADHLYNPFRVDDSRMKLEAALELLRLNAQRPEQKVNELPTVVEVNIGDVARQQVASAR